ncbi:hypothetical protein GH714_014669 [Hevea brasiliensis]|uniref:Cytochrome P450 n=1 Tax=Hevea brasiliensis TaxID=3981 RepID=A0A6A6LXH4_HEVBR|nr:hypothetical protein GH714_014669 [Hevea brasiliensis]
MVIILPLITPLIYLFWISRKASNKQRLPPEAAGGWPVIGHLHLLAGSQPPHIILGNLADQMGPIFTIKLGVHRALVVNSWELARDYLTTNDKAFANRPKALAMEILGYNYYMFGTSPYGEYWRQIRKIVTLEAIILAASDTTSVTLTWTLSLLLNNRRVLKKAQQELDTLVGRERQVKESDMKDLVYLQAIIKESFRLYPAAPLSVPHESIEDCSVGGYHIPAGTRLIVNVSKIHRDSRMWLNPSEFIPERFLTTHKDVDVKGQNFELLPFGSGRRMCPGVSFASSFEPYTCYFVTFFRN